MQITLFAGSHAGRLHFPIVASPICVMVFCGIGANYFVRMGRVGKSLANAFATPERLIVFDINALTKFSGVLGAGCPSIKNQEARPRLANYPTRWPVRAGSVHSSQRVACVKFSKKKSGKIVGSGLVFFEKRTIAFRLAGTGGKLASDRGWGRIGFRVWIIPRVDNS
jgi:hypothetical protein